MNDGINRYAKLTYKCTCGTVQEHYVWSKEVNKSKFPCTGEGCKLKVSEDQLFTPEKKQFTGIRTDTKNRV